MRPATGREEIELFNELPYVLNRELARDLEEGRRRRECMWMALRGERLVGRVTWWARSREATTTLLMMMMMDIFDLTEGEPLATRVELFRTAAKHALPERARPLDFLAFVPADWRDDAQARRTIETR